MTNFFKVSALFYGLSGAALLFFAQEVLTYLHLNIDIRGSLAIQLMGTLYLGFAFLNYNCAKSPADIRMLRPVLATNLGHASMALLTLVSSLGKLDLPFAYVIGLLCLTYLGIGLVSSKLILKPSINPKHV